MIWSIGSQGFDGFIFGVVALIIAITIHEFAHAWVAYLQGDSTAKMLGRLTLNPLSHLDPIGTVMILTTFFGWGKPVPYNPNNLKNGMVSEVLIALAGPAANLLLAFVVSLPLRIILMQHLPVPDGQIYVFLAKVAELNIFLAAFNIIPIPPLDGSKVLYLILGSIGIDRWRLVSLEQYGPMILLGLILMDRLIGTNILFTVLEPIVVLFNFIFGTGRF